MSISHTPQFKTIMACTLAAAFATQGQSVFAHTGIRDSVVSGARSYNALTIGHGCSAGEGQAQKAVIATSAVFPNGGAAVATNLASGEEISDLTGLIVDALPGDTSLPGLSPSLIQEKSIFSVMWEAVDANGNVRGFHWKNGRLKPELLGLPPFRVQAPVIDESSCVKSVKVRVAVANWCSTSQDANVNDRADIWMGNTTRRFNDADIVSVGYWPTLTVSRMTALPTSCGAGFDLAIEPSAADIDRFLPIKGFWPTP